MSTAVEATTDQTSSPNVYHEVKQGQTLWSIARAYGIDMQILARANQVSDVTALYVGQKLYVPGATQQREIISRCPCGPESVKLSSSIKPVSENLRPAERSSVSKAAPVIVPTKEVGLERIVFIWPIQGDVSRGFEQDAARRHDGIDIVAPMGASIRAAADGEVIFSGWGPGGYGRTVILQHQANVVTIYAHNNDNLVQNSQHVRQGEFIATVGQSGRATGTHLHFEVRYKTVPISPDKLLPPRPSHVATLDHN